MPNLQILKHMGEQAKSKSVLISSLRAENGIFYDLFRRGRHEYVEVNTRWKGGAAVACVLAGSELENEWTPTLDCIGCPTPDSDKCVTCLSSDLRQHWKRNAEMFMQEYGALFVDTQEAALSRDAIMACVSDKIFTNMYVQEKQIPRILSLDPALTGDQYAMVMMHIDDADHFGLISSRFGRAQGLPNSAKPSG